METGRPESHRGSESPRRARAADVLGPSFKRFFWHAYDHLGTLILANLLWLVLCLGVVTAPAATAGLFRLATRIAADEPATLSDFWKGFRMDFAPALKVGAFTAAAAVAVWFNFGFYSGLSGPLAFAGAAIAAILIWAAAFLLLMHAHLHPLVARGDRSLRSLLRKSALLTMDRPGFTIGVTLQALVLSSLFVVSGAGLVLVLGSFIALLLSTAHRELLKSYFPESPEAQEPPETRTLRDLLRPWESQRRS